MTAMIVGAALALLALGYVLYPLLAGAKPGEVASSESPCPNCGALAKPNASFCAGCGSLVNQHPTKAGLGNGS